MTMKLAKTPAKLLALLVMSLCCAAAGWAQSTPAMKPVPAVRKAKPVKAPPQAKPSNTPPPAGAGTAAKADTGGKRDPFAALINDKKEAGPHLPPGKAGLGIATVR